MARPSPLVYGATGFVGSNYVRMFPDCGIQQRDHLSPDGDYNRFLYLISTTDNYNVHDNPTLDIETNLIELVRRLSWIKNVKDAEFNFISSWFVYGDTELPAKESSCCNPKGFYSITKLAAEQLVASYCSTFGISYRILRLANVLGPDDKGVSAKKNALQYLTRKIVNGEPIKLYNGGHFIRDYIDVRDACKAINLVIDSGERNSIYNIGNGKGLYFNALIESVYSMVLGAKGKTPPIESMGVPEFHKIVQVTNMYMDNSKLVGLGYIPEFSINATLLDIIEQYEADKKWGQQNSEQ